jgi:DNA-binding CsgD family transcriptional regulator
MARLTNCNLQKLQDCILEIYSDLNMDTFHANMVSAIAKAIPASSVGYAEVSVANSALSKNVIEPFIALSPDEVTAFQTYLHEHPLMPLIYPQRTSHPFKKDITNFRVGKQGSHEDIFIGTALKIHDMLTRSQFHRLGIYNEFYRRLKIEHQMVVLLSCSSHSLNKNIAINRDRRDFTEEERLMLNLLAPHITQALKNVEVCETARKTFVALESSKQSLKSYGLTYREEDVLYWVAQGKSNAETARILKIAPGTVKIHLEKIYQKLGVENRTAASALAMGIMGSKKNVE